MGIRELYSLCYNNGSNPVLVKLKQWLEDLTLNVVVHMVAGKCYFGASSICDDDEARCQKTIRARKDNEKIAKELDDLLEGWLKEHCQRRIFDGIKAEKKQGFIDVMLSFQEAGHLSNFQYDADTSIKSTSLVC
ncbi:hypothetical protein REPUB_Repub19eG0037400 [Reevesia pubescens]